MLKSSMIVGSVLGLIVGCSSNCNKCTTDSDGKMAMTDSAFFAMAAGSNQTEVSMSQLALQHSQDPNVKQFAQKMIDDHTQANDKLKQFASGKNASLPTTLDDKHQSMVNRLSTLSGPDFDRAFLQDQVAAHQQTIDSFNQEVMTGADSDSRSFAQDMLPTLKMHLGMAQELEKATPYVKPTM